jgi:hypothetical protein
MKFSFEARIYKVGINPCVKVPSGITEKMTATKGYIRIKGKIERHPFTQTLVPVKNSEYRLYVNGPMLKGSQTRLGDTVKFSIEQDHTPWTETITMSPRFRKALQKHGLLNMFKGLIPSRQKEILRYLNYLKTEEARERNMRKVLTQLKTTKK